MTKDTAKSIQAICAAHGNDRTRMMDIVRDVQQKFGCVSSPALDTIAKATGVPRVEVESVVTFYAFLSEKPKGKIVIRLCNDVIDEMLGAGKVAKALSDELGIAFGATTPDGTITLEHTPCIGMCDQAPAALVNHVVVTNLTSDAARDMVQTLKKTGEPARLVTRMGDGNNADPLVKAMVNNNIRLKGEVIFGAGKPGEALRKAVNMTPAEVIRDIKTSRLRGRGGAGFPTGMKWEFTRASEGATRYVLCNADEGEPGTFKDRVILTELPEVMFEGMAIAGYAIGAAEGIVYLRAEYAYLLPFLQHKLTDLRKQGILGKNAGGKSGFNFDIRIQMGAGAYVCGEETSLISSCEGSRGDPKNRPPFPAQKGFLGCPTTVNNVETFCCVTRILDKGPGWFAGMGSKGSAGTKLLSISGDCSRPGVYEVPFGVPLAEVLKQAGAEDAVAVQIGGPSGQMVGKTDFKRTICYDDLATGGSLMVFNASRDVVRIALKFTEFFCEESCGYCTPCRVGNALIERKLHELLSGKGSAKDLDYLVELGKTMKVTSRCGLGQTAANPVVSTIKNFRAAYEKCIRPPADPEFLPTFDILSALQDSKNIAGRKSEIFE